MVKIFLNFLWNVYHRGSSVLLAYPISQLVQNLRGATSTEIIIGIYIELINQNYNVYDRRTLYFSKFWRFNFFSPLWVSLVSISEEKSNWHWLLKPNPSSYKQIVHNSSYTKGQFISKGTSQILFSNIWWTSKIAIFSPDIFRVLGTKICF